MAITILDGPMGTLLIERGIACPAPGWSAHALESDPDHVRQAHHEYVVAGADVHTTNTFRTRAESMGSQWKQWASEAVDHVRAVTDERHTIAGSIAPVNDCYRPDLSPPDTEPQHRMLAQHLAKTGVDVLLVETFPHIEEALSAVRAAKSTSLPVWASFTAGPNADLLTPEQIRKGAIAAVQHGASAVLVNCIPARDTLRFVQALTDAGVPFGAYANAGSIDDGIGWANQPDGPQRYADLAETWVNAGATLIGGCCGTGPHHTEELRRRFGSTCDQTAS